MVEALENYLLSRGRFPKVVSERISDGATAKFTYGGDLPPEGIITMHPGAREPSYAHELTHAGERELINHYYKNLQDKVPSSQFSQGYEKLRHNDGLRSQALRLQDPKNPFQSSQYRMSSPEVLAFGVESVVDPKPEYSLGGHSSATLATELAILLDLAARKAK